MEEQATEYQEAQEARDRVAAGLARARRAIVTGQAEVDDTVPPHMRGANW